MEIDLSKYDNSGYDHGAGWLKRTVWYLVSTFVFETSLFPVYSIKRYLLSLFGATVGRNVVIKPRVQIKYPWFIQIGDHVWIGEKVWIDNHTWVKIGSNSCISQGAYLVTGNHDYRDPHFGLIVEEIVLEDGVWIGAHASVFPGVRVGTKTVITGGSILTKEAFANGIYQGNPARWVKERCIKQSNE
jgi:putative colanic acid biosynthesis acetyltransferase WcaF